MCRNEQYCHKELFITPKVNVNMKENLTFTTVTLKVGMNAIITRVYQSQVYLFMMKAEFTQITRDRQQKHIYVLGFR